MKRLLVTGSRHWTDMAAISAALTEVHGEWADPTAVLVHGDARGADRIAARVWRYELGMTVEAHPADWYGPCRATCAPRHRRDSYCPMAGIYRSAEMVELGADLCLGFLLGVSAGTRRCMELARAAGIPVRPITAPSAVRVGGEQ